MPTPWGGKGADTYHFENASDLVDETGGDGIDHVISALGFNLANASQVHGDVENLTLTGVTNINGTGNVLNNTIVGNSGNNVLSDAVGNDTLNGGDGVDQLAGKEGNDKLIGGAGIDTLTGGTGADRLTGGLAADTFKFNTLAESTVAGAGRDTIVDFSHAQADKINLQAIDARTTVAGDQAFAFIGAAAFAGVAGQLRAEVVNGNSLVYGDVNGDAVADLSIVVADFTGLLASDFVL